VKEMPPTAYEAPILDLYKRAGGVVDHVLLDMEELDPAGELLHRMAALTGMRIVQGRCERHPTCLFRVTIDQAKPLAAKQVTVAQFLGSYYNLSARLLLLAGRGQGNPNEYFWWADNGPKGAAIRNWEIPTDGAELGYAAHGYAHAFTDPPYSLAGSRQEVQRLFAEFARVFFDDFSPQLVVYSWTTDWSNYFDAGHEWWGSSLWTVFVPSKKRLIWVGASTTD
jgi:hypothetical protein